MSRTPVVVVVPSLYIRAKLFLDAHNEVETDSSPLPPPISRVAQLRVYVPAMKFKALKYFNRSKFIRF